MEIWQLHMIHRDMKLANILLHFPDNPEVATMSRVEKRQFLADVDLTKIRFRAKISDFGLSTILESSTSQLSICGTPLYSAPQLLKKRGYSYKVDIWALGIMCYELLCGQTPFHSYEMSELLQKINEGKYQVETKEGLTIECALFLTQCLQANESDRINMQDLKDHPFIAFNTDDLEMPKLTLLDTDEFEKDVIRVSEVENGPKLKQSFTPRLDTLKRGAVEFTTQYSVQSRILKTHLKEADESQKFPRLELDLEEEHKEVEIEVEDPTKDEAKAKAEAELLLIQRQYQGSVDQRNFDEIEYDMKGRTGSIVIKQKDGKVSAQKKDDGFFSKMASLFGCGKPEQKVDTEVKNEQLIMNNMAKRESVDS